MLPLKHTEVSEAKKIAEAVKASGWEFACHTWGHLSVTGKSVETLATDQEKWQNTVANITGPTDTIIFAHGADIGSWKDYNAASNEQYAYYKDVPFIDHFPGMEDNAFKDTVNRLDSLRNYLVGSSPADQ